MEHRQEPAETAAGPAGGRGRPVRGWTAWSALAALLLSVGASLWFQLALPARVPDDADWAEVGRRLEAAYRPGDAVLVVPIWAEGLRLDLPADLPLHALPPDDPDLARAGRLWVAALPRAPRADVADALGVLSRRFGPPVVREVAGPVTLLRYDPKPAPDRFRLLDHVEEARVRVGQRACRWRPRDRAGARFQCPGGPWNYVARQTREIDYLPRDCIWAHPVDGAPLRITFPEVPAAGAVTLEAGFVGETALEPRAPVTLGLSVAGRPVGEAVVRPEPGWQTFRIETPGSRGPGPLTVTVTTPDATRRPLCFDGFVEEGGR